jgi:hypothetical protein
MAFELLYRFLSSNKNAFVIALFGAGIIAIAIVALGLQKKKIGRYNASLALASITVLYEFSAFFDALKEKSFSFEAIMPAVILSVVIPLITHIAAENLAELFWSDAEVEVEAKVSLPAIIADANIAIKHEPEPIKCANEKCQNTFIPTRGKKTCCGSCKQQVYLKNKKTKQ